MINFVSWFPALAFIRTKKEIVTSKYFVSISFIKKLVSGERIKQNWLVYSTARRLLFCYPWSNGMFLECSCKVSRSKWRVSQRITNTTKVYCTDFINILRNKDIFFKYSTYIKSKKKLKVPLGKNKDEYYEFSRRHYFMVEAYYAAIDLPNHNKGRKSTKPFKWTMTEYSKGQLIIAEICFWHKYNIPGGMCAFSNIFKN